MDYLDAFSSFWCDRFRPDSPFYPEVWVPANGLTTRCQMIVGVTGRLVFNGIRTRDHALF